MAAPCGASAGSQPVSARSWPPGSVARGGAILTGVAADICVLFTAADAHMREYDLWVPSDAVAGVTPERTAWAIDIMRDTLSAAVEPTGDLSLAEWIARGGGE